MDDFYLFCSTLFYFDGCNNINTNHLDIFYNIILVKKKLRLCCMVQPIDYLDINFYGYLMNYIKYYNNDLSYKFNRQGVLVFLTERINEVDGILLNENKDYVEIMLGK